MAIKTEVFQTITTHVVLKRGLFRSESFMLDNTMNVEEYLADHMARLVADKRMDASEVPESWGVEVKYHKRQWDTDNE